MVLPFNHKEAKALNIVGALTIVNRGISEINEEGPNKFTLTRVEM